MLKYNKKNKTNLKSLNKNHGCNCQTSPIYHTAPAGCADDDAAVAALPDKLEVKHGGPILANYLKETEKTHERILQDISDGANTVNDNIDSKIRALSENLLTHIQQNQNEICCVINQYSDLELAPLEKKLRDDALKQIYELHAQRVDEMAHFKREAAVLERERAEGLRLVLRDHFQRLVGNAHLPPRDLLHDFDERAYEINQQLLSNTRAYAELEAQLRVQVDEAVGKARSTINQLCLGLSVVSRGQSAIPWASEERTTVLRSPSSIGEKRKNSVPSLGLLLNDAKEFDAIVARLLQAYKAAVMRVLTGFSDKLSDLEKDLEAHHCFVDPEHHTSQSLEFHEMVDKTVCRLSTSIHKKHIASRELLEITGADMLAMQKSLWSLGESLQDTFHILHDAGHLWDAHILRQALAQKLTIAAVEDLFTSNDTLEMANEVTFNVALEQLRGAYDAVKLEHEYGAIMVMLEHTSDMYRLHSEAELRRLEEFMNLPSCFANILLSEFGCFLEKHPRLITHPAVNGSNSQGFNTPKATIANIHSPIPRAVLQTELQELALCNWRNGFLESFESNVSLVPEELRRQARIWVEERANALHMRYTLKLVSHSVRLERVKAARDLRFSELRYHESRLDSHLDALYQLIESLPIDASSFSSLDAPYLYPLGVWINRIKEGIDSVVSAQETMSPEVKRLKMSSYLSRLAKHRKLFEESLITAVDGYKRHLEHRVQNARISNVRFMSQIKLFSEGGRYAAQEAARAGNALTNGADALDSCVNRVMDALNRRRHELLSLADQQVVPLQRLCESSFKPYTKPSPVKTKPTGRKK